MQLNSFIDGKCHQCLFQHWVINEGILFSCHSYLQMVSLSWLQSSLYKLETNYIPYGLSLKNWWILVNCIIKFGIPALLFALYPPKRRSFVIRRWYIANYSNFTCMQTVQFKENINIDTELSQNLGQGQLVNVHV